MKQVVYIASPESKQIYVWNLNKQGKLMLLQRLTLFSKPQSMKISPSGQYLYVGVRSNFAIITYLILPEGILNQQAITSIPITPTYIEIEQLGRWLFVPSYHHGSLVVLPVNQQGIVQSAIQIINNLAHPHASVVDFDNSYLFVPCLGEDHIRIYIINSNGYLTELTKDRIITNPGAGPRHLVFSPNHNVFYCLNELNATINVYSVLKNYQQIQSCNILPISLQHNKPWAADIHITPDGCHLYASERSANIIRHFLITANGLLLPTAIYITEMQPRGFNIDQMGYFLLVAGQKSNYISVYKIDKVTGTLQLLDRYPTGIGPVWVTTHLIRN